MNWKRIGLALGATAITGAGVYAGNQYLSGGSSTEGAPITLAEQSELVAEAISTDCGLVNASDDPTAKAGVVSASVTRARVTASQNVEAGEDIAAAIEAGDCRYRLDGVWVQDLPLALDQSVVIDGYTNASGTALDQSLLHGTFVTRDMFLIEASDDGNELTLKNASDPSIELTANAADDTSLADVFKPGGERKTYELAGEADQTIEVDVTRTGRVRLRINGTNFYRPQADALGERDVASSDAWMIERNLDNVDASLKGYDVYAQDLFRLNQNAKAKVFQAADPTAYTVTEKRTVPLGLKLVPEGAQGSVTNSSLIRTERQYQRTVAQSIGVKVGFQGEDSEGGIGASYAESNTTGMREGSAHSIASGFARHKIYALVLDKPFVRLSDEFVDAVEDARRYDRYDELIERFGTHYPYAVTYGSAAKMTAEFTENTVASWENSSKDVNSQAGLAIAGFGVSSSMGVFEENQQSNEQLNSAESKSFEAVGGTGSFSQDGMASGTPYPILADLRPLHELLSPLNFPGEPEVYTEVRGKLRDAIAAYLAQFGQELSDVRPEIERHYTITPTRISCERDMNGALPSDNGKVTLKGSIVLTHAGGRAPSGASTIRHALPWAGREFVLNCKSGTRYANFPARSLTIKGKKSQLGGTRFNWVGDVDGTRHVIFAGTDDYATGQIGRFNLPINLKVGETSNEKAYVINRSNYPKIAVVAQVKRVR